MSEKGISKTKVQQFIGLFAGLVIFVSLLIIALVTKPKADINDIGKPVVAWGPTQDIVSYSGTADPGAVVGKARLAILDRPVAGQSVRVALVVESTKDWALKDSGQPISLASLFDIFHTDYNKQITLKDRSKMDAAVTNQFNGFTLSRLPKPIVKAGGNEVSIPANNWTVSDSITEPKTKSQLEGWVSKNNLICKLIDLSEGNVTDETTLKAVLSGFSQTLDANKIYCADSSLRVVSNLDLYGNGQNEEFVYLKKEAVDNQGGWFHPEIIHNAQLMDVYNYSHGGTTQDPYLIFPHTPVSKADLLDIETAKLRSTPNSTSLAVLPEGRIITEFTISVPALNAKNQNLELNIPLKYSAPNQSIKGVQNIGDPFALRKKSTRALLPGSQYPYYRGPCSNALYESSYGGSYNCKKENSQQWERCSTNILNLNVINCPSGKKYRTFQSVNGNQSNVYDVGINNENRLNAVTSFSASKTADLSVSAPIVIPQILTSVSTVTNPSSGVITSGDSISATAVIKDQFGDDFINRVGITHNWKVTKGASNVTILNGTGQDATIIGVNNTTGDVFPEVILEVTSGQTTVTSSSITITIHPLAVNELFSSVIVTPTSETLESGEHLTLTAIAMDGQNAAPESVIKSYQWTIGDESALIVSGNKTSKQLEIVARNISTTKSNISISVRVTDINNFSHTGNALVTVNATPSSTTTTTSTGVVTSAIELEITPGSLSLVDEDPDLDSAQITATLSDNGSPVTSSSASYDWNSDISSAIISGSGRTITVSAGSVSEITQGTIILTTSYNGYYRSGSVGVTIIPKAIPVTTQLATTTTTTTAVPARLHHVEIYPSGTQNSPISLTKGEPQTFNVYAYDQNNHSYSLNNLGPNDIVWDTDRNNLTIPAIAKGPSTIVTGKTIGTMSQLTVSVVENGGTPITTSTWIKVPRKLTSVTIDRPAVELSASEFPTSFKATAKDQEGVVINGASGLTFDWSTPNSSNVSLENINTDTVKVSLVDGKVNTNNTISVSVKYEREEIPATTASIKVLQTITSVTVEGYSNPDNEIRVQLNGPGAMINTNKTFTLEARDEKGNIINRASQTNPTGATFNWDSNKQDTDIDVEKISEGKLNVTALKWGRESTINISGTYRGATITSASSPKIIITSPRQLGEVSVANASVETGSDVVLTATAKDTDQEVMSTGLSYTWVANNNNVSIVSTSGASATIKGMTTGTSSVTVTATYSPTGRSLSKTATVTILDTTTTASTTTTTTTTTTTAGTELWWFDNTSRICQKKIFSGAYMYEGLRTFATQAECVSALNENTTTSSTTTTSTAVPTTTTTTVPDSAGPDYNGHNTTYNFPTSSTFISLVKNIPIKTGWNMLSFPYEVTPINTAIPRFKGLFSDSIYTGHLRWYKSPIKAYEDQYHSATPVGLGTSSFVYSENDRTADASDNVSKIQTLSTSQAHAFEIPLNSSDWTMVGNPYSTSVKYDDQHVFVKIGNAITTITNAISSSLTTQAYGLNSETNSYVIIHPSDTLNKYQGFWIKTNQTNAKLLISPVNLTPAN